MPGNVRLVAIDPSRVSGTVTIGGGQSLSDAADLGDGTLLGVAVPAGWNGPTVVTFQGSPDGVTFSDVQDGAGEYATVALSASQAVAVNPDWFRPFRHVKVRSGTAAIPVAQAGGDTITVMSGLVL